MSTATDGMEEIVKEFLAESAEGLDLLERDLIELERDTASPERLGEIFRAMHTLKGSSGMLGYPKLESIAHAGEGLLGGLRDGKLALHPGLTSGLLAMVDAIRAVMKVIELTGKEGDANCEALVRSLEDLHGNAAAQYGPAPSCEAPDSGVSDPFSEKRVGGSKIRVDASLLDQMMDLAGELILARNHILRLTASRNDSTMLSAAQRLKRVTTNLQDAVMKARLQPIGSVWSKFPRLAHDLASSCGKQAIFTMDGSETELDRGMVEAVKDPLTHILRNAIDHGIETPEQRTRAGKMATGHLRFRAFHEEGQVHVEVSDDGAGIDLVRVQQSALKRGLITPEQAAEMSERQLAGLVFTPGFSTAEKVTSISGRGVGLDVVKTNVEKIGGTVDLQSVSGQGTTVHIKIPLTLAVVPALIVSCAGQGFAIPQVSLAEVVRMEPEPAANPIETLCGAPVYRLRQRLLPLCFLDRTLRLRSDTSAGAFIVVLQASANLFGLVVDAIHDPEEIVVKPLGQHLRAITCFAGATVLGDGQVVLILDVASLMQLAGLNAVSRVLRAKQAPEAKRECQPATAQSWLIFRGTSGSRFALPLPAVSRLEEIPAASIERAAGREVVRCGVEIMPLLRLSRLFDEPEPARELLPVVVLRGSGHSAGLVVDGIEDIVEEIVELGDRVHDGLSEGAAVIQARVADVLSVKSLLARAHGASDPHTLGGSA
jgi:two-component system chemotaxis sensor kinase CheA